MCIHFLFSILITSCMFGGFSRFLKRTLVVIFTQKKKSVNPYGFNVIITTSGTANNLRGAPDSPAPTEI